VAGAAILDFLYFLNVKGRRDQEGQYASPCQILWRLVKPLMAIFRIFEDGGRLPFCICGALVWTIHQGNLVISITVQNLVGIDTVVSIICKFLGDRL